jgi:hypothetical protein
VFARCLYLSPLLSVLLITCCSAPQEKTSVSPQASRISETRKAPSAAVSPHAVAAADSATKVLMHNVVLSEPPGLNLRVRWLRGQMLPTRLGTVPSFDEPNSFVLVVQDGIVALNLSDVATVLNAGALKDSSLEHVSLGAQGKQLKLNGTLHKGVPLPVEMISDLSTTPTGQIHLHVAKLRLLKLPVTGLLKSFHLRAADLFHPTASSGIQVAGDDIYFTPEQILPAPHIRGRLTDVHIDDKGVNLVSVFGIAQADVSKVKEWRNFIRLLGGTLNFGKLTMTDVDLVLIDDSQDEWFYFDLSHYQEQLVNGRIRMTPQAGVRIFMPDIEKIPPNAANRAISLQWMKNRNVPPPADLDH